MTHAGFPPRLAGTGYPLAFPPPLAGESYPLHLFPPALAGEG
jgi:hypothetical protein